MSKGSVALIQAKASADPSQNLKQAKEKIVEASKQGAKIICLQELFRTSYFCVSEDHENFKLAEPIPGPTTQELSELARAKEIVIVVPLFEKRAQGIYHNSAVVIDADGSLVGHYRKMHIPDDPCFYEKFYFTPGDLGFIAVQTRYAKIGVLICWDQWFPEAARLMSLNGAEILFYPTAIGWHESETEEARNSQLSSWQVIQRSHAVSNGNFVVTCNRVGDEGPLKFWGHSFLADPSGNILKEASENKEEILAAELDLGLIESQRQNWPFLRDRRIDAYGGILHRYLDKKEHTAQVTRHK